MSKTSVKFKLYSKKVVSGEILWLNSPQKRPRGQGQKPPPLQTMSNIKTIPIQPQRIGLEKSPNAYPVESYDGTALKQRPYTAPPHGES